MDDKEAIQMMERCKGELEGLRREIDRAKIEAFHTITKIVNGGSGVYSEDLVWILKREIEKLKTKQEENVSADNNSSRS